MVAEKLSDQVQPACHRWENVSAGRYYEARMVRDLFGDWQVMRVWGGIGSGHGAVRFAPLAEPGAFAAVLERIDKRRAQRGLHPAAVKPNLMAQLRSGRLTAEHFAYLRGIAQGLSRDEMARLYLGIEHGAEVEGAHRLVVELAAAVARRRRDPRWRLIGLAIEDAPAAQLGPPLEEWAEAEGLDGFRESELQELYVERFGVPRAGTARRLARNARLRSGRLALLRELERAAALPAAPSDLLEGWLAPELAEQLHRVGLLTLADLRERIRLGGRWWACIRAYGPKKAARLATYLDSLIGPAEPVSWPLQIIDRSLLDGSRGVNRATGPSSIDARDDREAIDAWIKARSGSAATEKQYRRQAERFALWMILERGRALSQASAEDCTAYLAFLADVPARWTSHSIAERFAPGWAPFRGSLSLKGRKVAVSSLQSLFSWLVKVRYAVLNPWDAVNRKLGDDPGAELDIEHSRAFTPRAWNALMTQIRLVPDGPANARMRWLLAFGEATGLRASELTGSRREHLIQRRNAEGRNVWFARVHGKGRKNRLVPVPSTAIAATRAYFKNRGIDFDAAPADTPLLATLDGSPLSYGALYDAFTRFVRRAIDASALDADERRHAGSASTHWLRHTHGKRAAERGVDRRDLQDNFGHSDSKTTDGYYPSTLGERAAAMERAFGGIDV